MTVEIFMKQIKKVYGSYDNKIIESLTIQYLQNEEYSSNQLKELFRLTYINYINLKEQPPGAPIFNKINKEYSIIHYDQGRRIRDVNEIKQITDGPNVTSEDLIVFKNAWNKKIKELQKKQNEKMEGIRKGIIN